MRLKWLIPRYCIRKKTCYFCSVIQEVAVFCAHGVGLNVLSSCSISPICVRIATAGTSGKLFFPLNTYVTRNESNQPLNNGRNKSINISVNLVIRITQGIYFRICSTDSLHFYPLFNRSKEIEKKQIFVAILTMRSLKLCNNMAWP